MGKEKAKVSVKDLLRSNNKSIFPVKKRSGIPVNNDNAPLADAVHGLYEKYKEAETEFRAQEALLIDEARKLYEENAKTGDFSKSINFEGTKTHGMQVSFQDKFQAIPLEHEEEIKGELQSKKLKFEEFFQEKRSLKLVDTSDETIQLLQKKLGEELFLKLFAIDLAIETKSDMDKNQFRLPEQVKSLLKQSKPACKARVA